VFTDEKNVNQVPRIHNEFNCDLGKVLCDFDITEELVGMYFKRLKLNKAPGTDDITSRVLVETTVSIAKPLCLIYRKTLSESIVPKEWKRANVCAILKKEAKNDPCNYRPVSLTSHVCKVLESIFHDAMLKHLVEYNFINGSQHGFMRRKSCLTNLLEFLEFVGKHVDNGEPVDVLYLDFQKAFDKVPHCRLMVKLRALGIQGNIADWIKD